MGGQSQAATDLCADIEVAAWRHECFFLLADRLVVSGRDAVEACALAGVFASECVEHAKHRELQQAELRLEEGREPEIVRELAQVARTYHPDATEENISLSADLWVAFLVARRTPAESSDPAVCSAASPRVCEWAARMMAPCVEGRDEASVDRSAAGSDRCGSPDAWIARMGTKSLLPLPPPPPRSRPVNRRR
jgi:hypothetical protein